MKSVPMTAASVAANLAFVRERIAKAGGDADAIALVAVTKDFGPDAVDAALDNGLADVGENRADQLDAKAAAVTRDARWHYLARVQRRQVRRIASRVTLWQAIDRLAAAEEIAKHAPGAAVLVQVNVSGEPQKHGARTDDAPAVVEAVAALGLDVRGLMAVGPNGPPEAARAGFRTLTRLADRLDVPVRSMGMTDDLEVAVQEGSTMLRIGRGLFGPRPSTT
ncbi:MAG: YggS family pyridoxal phosphate-dependent enzyme [Acidimicrobiia bacterium]|nr:YggS family pyridoxal phosphate-dependent enzyme [Acidimicrobiia bacterium]